MNNKSSKTCILINRISKIPLSKNDIKELEEVLWSELGTKEEYENEYGQKSPGELVREIVGLDMNADT
nr:type I restriction-modification enzyme R subunit C-terminal domain-containing protein [Lachnoanaerobaculum saburreum]